MPGTLRIIAGELRGRRLRVPAGRRVRPTAERVREALFSILGSRVRGAIVLEPFAGSGALGLEALSRGAGHVTFCERDRAALRCLADNVAALGVGERCRVVPGPAARLLAAAPRAGAPFDLVLADPPYAGRVAPFLARLEASGRLRPGSWVVVERDRDTDAVPTTPAESLNLFRTERYGRTCLDFYRAEPGVGAPADSD